MRIRTFIAAIMILLSLSAQARTVFACSMMPGAALSHCCCPAEGKDRCPSWAGDRRCCDQVNPSDAPVAHALAAAYGKHQAPPHPLDLPTPLAPDARLLPDALDPGRQSKRFTRARAQLHRACPLYLETARLRL